ncbi:NAD-dependent succinate-semialdehyde dehydrogenase [Arthrobacter rhombi]|uniref:NAD-dependent succinate-semialdehyde dehydrogenase n=1 Tax=Arthrobacter rhombi TaxID=71253 RepID=UPI003FD03999
MSTYASVNPATGETVKEFATTTNEEIEAAMAASNQAYASWSAAPIEDRAAIMNRAADLMGERSSELASIITLEMGKLHSEAEGEVQLASDILRYYATEAPAILADETLQPASGGSAVVVSEPIGPLVGVMPWNFPYYQIARFAGPNLMAGNTILLKHASSCPQAALAFDQLMHDAGVPRDAYINIFASNDQIQDMLADSRVRGASVTGSEGAGSAVATGASEHLKPVVLELGGSDPFIVLDAKDLDATVAVAVAGRVTNAGQSCIASKRLIVLEDLYEDFVEKFTEQMAALVPGDPAKEGTTLAPLSSEDAAIKLVEQVEDAVSKGAKVTTGGGRVDRVGAFVEATVLTGVTREMRAFSEELFGPVAVIYRVSDEEEALALANESSFGLGGTVMSDDISRAQELARRINTGMVWINQATWTEPDLPFGGTKRSGVGRELGEPGIQQFLNKKLVRTP